MAKADVSNSAIRRKGPVGRPKSQKHTPSEAVDKRDNAKNGYQIRSVTKALDLLEAICDGNDDDVASNEEVRVTQLSKKVGLHKAGVFRLLATFESRGYVERQEQSGFYRIGMNAFEMGRKLLSRMTILSQAHPVMEDLCRRCNEAVYLAVRRGSDFLLIDLVESAQQVKVASLLGKRFPLTSGAPGQLMLAFSGQPNIVSTVTDSDFQAIRQQGYCFDQGGLGEFVSCLAAPLFNAAGSMVGAVCVVSPSFRMLEQQIDTSLLPILKDASEIISAKLGYLKHHRGLVRL
jgi:DNA-binding IclR family transcriptional regulator